MIVIGLDPGACVGLAVWDTVDLKLLKVESARILETMRRVKAWKPGLVIFEDARLRGCFDKADKLQAKYGAAIREGAGSAKRDCAIWEEFLEEENIPYMARRPYGTKKRAEELSSIWGWTARTNEHGRDAALVVAGLNTPMAEGIVRAWQQRSISGQETKRSSKKAARSAGTPAPRSTTAGAA